jgi:hypothetical protein
MKIPRGFDQTVDEGYDIMGTIIAAPFLILLGVLMLPAVLLAFLVGLISRGVKFCVAKWRGPIGE